MKLHRIRLFKMLPKGIIPIIGTNETIEHQKNIEIMVNNKNTGLSFRENIYSYNSSMFNIKKSSAENRDIRN